MSNEKMREAFEAFVRSKGGSLMKRDGHYIESMTHLWLDAWQAATAATQRDAMAVAEAVRDGIAELTNDAHRVDLAAIVEAVRPGRQEALNQQMLAALNGYDNIVRIVLNGLQRDYEERGMMIRKEFHDELKVAHIAACEAIAAAEAAQPVVPQSEHDLSDVRCECCGYFTYQREHMGCIRASYQPASAQQQGEPVTFDDADQLARQYSTATQPDEYHFTKAQLACFVQCLFDAADGSMPLHPQQQGEPVAWYTDWHPDGRKYAAEPHGFDDPHAVLDDEELIREVWVPLYPSPECSVPDGWQLVPIEPTREMFQAVNKEDDKAFSGGSSHGIDFETAWSVALDAAPKPERGV